MNSQRRDNENSDQEPAKPRHFRVHLPGIAPVDAIPACPQAACLEDYSSILESFSRGRLSQGRHHTELLQ